MPRQQQSASNDSAQLSCRVDEELKAAYKERLDEEGRSISEDMRRRMERVVGERDAPAWLPESEDLRTAYQLLDQLAAPDTGRIDVDTAETKVAEELGVPKAAVQRSVLELLRRHDPTLVEPAWGVLVVRRPVEEGSNRNS